MVKQLLTTCLILTMSLIQLSCLNLEKEVEPPTPIPIPTPRYPDTVQHFSTCTELKDLLIRRQNEIKQLEADPQRLVCATILLGSEIDLAPIRSPQAQTNSQQAGIDEADPVKLNDNYIFIASSDVIRIIKQDSLETVYSLHTNNITSSLFTYADLLLVIGNEPASNYQAKTNVHIYQISEQGTPTLLKRIDLPFYTPPSSFRLYGNKLIYTETTALDLQDAIDKISDSELYQIPCNNILPQPIDSGDLNLTEVVMIDLDHLEQDANRLGMLGSGEIRSMSEKSIILVKNSINWEGVCNEFVPTMNETIITKVSIDAEKGSFAYKGKLLLPGKIYSSWAIQDYPEQNFLTIATTTTSFPTSNNLWIIKETQDQSAIEILSSIKDIAIGEKIYAIRHWNQFAYITTYEHTDSLLAIDLTNPQQPRIMDKLEAPGFTEYLHPMGSHFLLSIGQTMSSWDDRSVFLSLFDVSNPLQLKLQDTKPLANNTSSPVSSDYHSFFFDPDSQLVAIPFSSSSCSRFSYVPCSVDNGLAIYKVTDKIDELRVLSHKDLCLPSESCNSVKDIYRSYRLNNDLLTISDIGIRTYDINDLSVVTGEKKF